MTEAAAIRPGDCPRCHTDSPGSRLYCGECGQLQPGELNVIAATWTDRAVASMIDIFLFIVTIGIGWLIWTVKLSNYGQTPGKRLIGLRVYRKSGQPASQFHFLARDVAIKPLLFSAIFTGYGIFIVINAINYLWPLPDRSGQSLIDRITDTIIVRPKVRWTGKEDGNVAVTQMHEVLVRNRKRDDGGRR